MAAEASVRLFGDKSRFALELSIAAEQPRDAVPLESVGTWGAWTLHVAGLNLCRLQVNAGGDIFEIEEVRWFLAPLIRWLVTSWLPLLHEAHLPNEAGWGDRRPRWARLSYLAMLERYGDDIVRFIPWQEWASRHALRAAAEGGIVPDIFFQRVADEIEITWGDRLQPGGEAAAFLVEDGVARIHVDAVAETLKAAIDWFFRHEGVRAAGWSGAYAKTWQALLSGDFGLEPLYWYLDRQKTCGPLSGRLLVGLTKLGKDPPRIDGLWLGSLSPEVAMFGDLTPMVSRDGAVALLAAYFHARSNEPEAQDLVALTYDDPAWSTVSPWESGYALALDLLHDADPRPADAYTRLDLILQKSSISVRDIALGREGPRGVALAGSGLRPTIIINIDHPTNRHFGRRFTQAHEFCHILFDRQHARPLTHCSTPWASPSVEQRANAFAAMLLMPPGRATRPAARDIDELNKGVRDLARRLRVSKVALSRHLANLGEIDTTERDLLGG